MDLLILVCKLWGIFSAGVLVGYCLCALLSVNKIQQQPDEIGREEAKS
jgi:hypothetical protein